MTTEDQTTAAPNTNGSADTSQPATPPATAAAPVSQPQQTAQDQTPAVPAAKTDDTAKPQGAPDAYDFKAPEGQTFDEAIVKSYADVAKELDLPQDKAQKMLETMAPAIAKRQAEQFEATKTQWAEDAKVDKEFGGDKLQENLSVALKARDAFATPELRTLLDETGLGNHPEVIRFFYRAGKAISEDSFAAGRTGNAAPGDARRLYAASNMNP